MTAEKFIEVLRNFSKSENIPLRHYEFSKPASAPCMVYFEIDGENIAADSLNVYDEVYMRVELYARPEDISSSEKFEQALHDADLTYDRDRSWISERHEVMYIYDVNI